MWWVICLQEDEEAFWGSRPLSEEVIHTALFNVLYLGFISKFMEDDYNEPLNDIADVYVSSLRNTHENHYNQQRRVIITQLLTHNAHNLC